MKNCGLLVSVRDEREAQSTAESDVSIIDAKEPNSGSLGCVSLASAKAIASSVPPNKLKSIALGEVAQWPPWPGERDSSVQNVLQQFNFAKVGLSNLRREPDWRERWSACLSTIPPTVKRVAVVYADYELAQAPDPMAIVEAASTIGCSVLLVDTCSKGQGSLFDFLEVASLIPLFEAARREGLKIVIAGSLNANNLDEAFECEPDYIAVRDAVCTKDRKSPIAKHKIDDLVSQIKEFNTRNQSVREF